MFTHTDIHKAKIAVLPGLTVIREMWIPDQGLAAKYSEEAISSVTSRNSLSALARDLILYTLREHGE